MAKINRAQLQKKYSKDAIQSQVESNKVALDALGKKKFSTVSKLAATFEQKDTNLNRVKFSVSKHHAESGANYRGVVDNIFQEKVGNKLFKGNRHLKNIIGAEASKGFSDQAIATTVGEKTLDKALISGDIPLDKLKFSIQDTGTAWPKVTCKYPKGQIEFPLAGVAEKVEKQREEIISSAHRERENQILHNAYDDTTKYLRQFKPRGWIAERHGASVTFSRGTGENKKWITVDLDLNDPLQGRLMYTDGDQLKNFNDAVIEPGNQIEDQPMVSVFSIGEKLEKMAEERAPKKKAKPKKTAKKVAKEKPVKKAKKVKEAPKPKVTAKQKVQHQPPLPSEKSPAKAAEGLAYIQSLIPEDIMASRDGDAIMIETKDEKLITITINEADPTKCNYTIEDLTGSAKTRNRTSTIKGLPKKLKFLRQPMLSTVMDRLMDENTPSPIEPVSNRKEQKKQNKHKKRVQSLQEGASEAVTEDQTKALEKFQKIDKLFKDPANHLDRNIQAARAQLVLYNRDWIDQLPHAQKALALGQMVACYHTIVREPLQSGADRLNKDQLQRIISDATEGLTIAREASRMTLEDPEFSLNYHREVAKTQRLGIEIKGFKEEAEKYLKVANNEGTPEPTPEPEHTMPSPPEEPTENAAQDRALQQFEEITKKYEDESNPLEEDIDAAKVQLALYDRRWVDQLPSEQKALALRQWAFCHLTIINIETQYGRRNFSKNDLARITKDAEAGMKLAQESVQIFSSDPEVSRKHPRSHDKALKHISAFKHHIETNKKALAIIDITTKKQAIDYLTANIGDTPHQVDSEGNLVLEIPSYDSFKIIIQADDPRQFYYEKTFTGDSEAFGTSGPFELYKIGRILEKELPDSEGAPEAPAAEEETDELRYSPEEMAQSKELEKAKRYILKRIPKQYVVNILPRTLFFYIGKKTIQISFDPTNPKECKYKKLETDSEEKTLTLNKATKLLLADIRKSPKIRPNKKLEAIKQKFKDELPKGTKYQEGFDTLYIETNSKTKIVIFINEDDSTAIAGEYEDHKIDDTQIGGFDDFTKISEVIPYVKKALAKANNAEIEPASKDTPTPEPPIATPEPPTATPKPPATPEPPTAPPETSKEEALKSALQYTHVNLPEGIQNKKTEDNKVAFDVAPGKRIAIFINKENPERGKFQTIDGGTVEFFPEMPVEQLMQKVQEETDKLKSATSAEPEAAPTATDTAAETLDPQAAREALKAKGVTIILPINLTELSQDTSNQLLTIGNTVKRNVEEKHSITDAVKILKKAGKHLKTGLEGTQITQVQFDTGIGTIPLVWENGEFKDLEATLAKYKKFQEVVAPELAENIGEVERSDARRAELESIRAEKRERNKQNGIEGSYLYLNGYMPVDKSIGSMWEGTMNDVWKDLDHHQAVERAMTKWPFNIHSANVASKTAVRIITEGDNDDVRFADIFTIMHDVIGQNGFKTPKPYTTADGTPKMLSQDLLTNGEDFLQEVARLQRKTDRTAEEQAQLEHMINEYIMPCIEFIEAVERLKYHGPPKADEESDYEYDQEIIGNLEKTADYDDREYWSAFDQAMGDSADDILMSDFDGTTFAMSSLSKFGQGNSKEAMIKILTNQREPSQLYEIDPETGIKTIDEEALTAEINRLIMLGYMNIFSKEMNETGMDINATLESQDFRENLELLQVTSIKEDKLTDDQMRTFQLGFQIDQSNRMNIDIAEGQKSLVKRPQFKDIVDQLLEAGIPKKQIEEVQDGLLAAGYVQLQEDYSFDGAGLGIPIPLSDDYTMIINFGGTKSQGAFLSSTFNINLFKFGAFEVGAAVEIGIGGFSVGATGKTDLGKIDILKFAGARWNWADLQLLPDFGGGLHLTWDYNDQYQEEKAEAVGELNETDFKQAWDAWQAIPETNVEQRLTTLKEKVPAVYNKYLPVIESFAKYTVPDDAPAEEKKRNQKLLDMALVQIISNEESDVATDVLMNLESPVPILEGLGFTMIGGLVPFPTVEFKIYESNVLIPNHRAIAKALELISDAETTDKLKSAIAQFESGQAEGVKFQEMSPRMVYGRDGELLSLVKSTEANLGKWSDEGGVENYNKALQETEMRLEQSTANGPFELKIWNTDDKDTEIHIDPLLEGLAIIKDGDRIVLEGSIEQVAISRERFFLPYKGSESASSVRDVITIRQKSSFEGNRDRTYIETYESKMLVKNEGDQEFTIHSGAAHELEQDNIMELAGYADGGWADMNFEDQQAVEPYRNERPDLSKRTFSQAEITQKEALFSSRREAMETMLAKEYQEEAIRADFFTILNDAYRKPTRIEFEGKRAQFKMKLTTLIDNPEKIIELVSALPAFQETPMNNREANMAVSHILNLWFTQLATKKSPNKTIRAGLEARRKFLRDQVFVPKFKEGIDRLDLEDDITAEEVADEVMEAMYGDLIAALEDPNFDFQALKIKKIPNGAHLYSGSRKRKGKKTIGTFAETINYQDTDQQGNLVHSFGFLEDPTGAIKTNGAFSIHSEDERERTIARVLLESLSPTNVKTENLLSTPLAKKVLSMRIHAFLATEEDHQVLTGLMQNPEQLKNPTSEQQATLDRFRELLKRIRASQESGEPIVEKIEGKEVTAVLDFTGESGDDAEGLGTKVGYGAYSKCGNATLYIIENGTAQLLGKDHKLISVYNETTEMAQAQIAKRVKTFGLMMGISEKEVPQEGEGGKPNEPNRPTGKTNMRSPTQQGAPPGRPNRGMTPPGRPNR